MITFNYLAKECSNKKTKTCPLTAAMCICMPWDMMQTSHALEGRLNWLFFNNILTQSLCDIVRRNAQMLSKSFDVPRVLKVGIDAEFLKVEILTM